MIEDQRGAINAEPCQRRRTMKGGMWIDVFKMVPAFIAEISGNEESFGDAFFDFDEKLRDVFNPVDRKDSCGVKEEKTPFIPAVEPGSLK
jgi:hypothetical protein